MKLPWVGWYTKDGDARLSTWTGETRCVVVTHVDGDWWPGLDVPEGSRVLELPPPAPGTDARDTHHRNLDIARAARGVMVIVFESMPRVRP